MNGIYVNEMGHDERIHDAYPTATLTRLVEVKDRYDPANFFRMNQNIEPTRRWSRVPRHGHHEAHIVSSGGHRCVTKEITASEPLPAFAPQPAPAASRQAARRKRRGRPLRAADNARLRA